MKQKKPPPMLAECFALSVLFHIIAVKSVHAGISPELQTDIVSEQVTSGSFPLLKDEQAAPIVVDRADWAGVMRAGADLQADVERVSGINPAGGNL